MDKTILYYSSNREDPVFEQKIVDDLLSKAGNLPIISVTQKPMNVGKNICIGDKGQSYINEWRQIVIGAKEATTEYLIMAESDFLYPPEYFQFEPKGENIYLYDNVWIMWMEGTFKSFHRKSRSEGAQVIKRQYLIDILEAYLVRYPGWWGEEYKKEGPHHSPYFSAHRKKKIAFFHGENPSISVKTRQGINWMVGRLGGKGNISRSLPYWGDVKKLRNKFL